MPEQPASIWDLKMFPWDRATPRFYPPGQHPAFAQMRRTSPRTSRIDRVVAGLTPTYSAASAVGLGWLGRHFPGLPTPSPLLSAKT